MNISSFMSLLKKTPLILMESFFDHDEMLFLPNSDCVRVIELYHAGLRRQHPLDITASLLTKESQDLTRKSSASKDTSLEKIAKRSPSPKPFSMRLGL